MPQPVVPFLTRFFFGWEGSPTQIDCRKKGALILTSLLDLGCELVGEKLPARHSTVRALLIVVMIRTTFCFGFFCPALLGLFVPFHCPVTL